MDVIFSIGANYPDEVFSRYLDSLRRVNQQAQVFVAIPDGQLRPSLAQIFSQNSANPVLYPGGGGCIPVCARFGIYLELLDRLREQSELDWVLHTDLRDVIFQRDPFLVAKSMGTGLVFALEDGLIGQSSFNCDWLKEGFGEEILTSIIEKQISCAGTTIGTAEKMRFYFERMKSLVLDDGSLQRAAKRNDQGVHNYLLWTGLLNDCEPLTIGNDSELFLTLGLMKARVLSAEGYLLNRNGNVSAIAHQIDRLDSQDLLFLGEKIGVPVWDLVEACVAREVIERMRSEGKL